MDRRDFLKTTATAAVLAGPAVIGARGANDKINIGWIGVGTRGNAGIDWLKKAAPDTVTITAICDTFQGYTGQLRERSRSAGREFHRRGVQHDAGASASRHGHAAFRAGGAGISKTAGPHYSKSRHSGP